jgi:hypothetical protein
MPIPPSNSTKIKEEIDTSEEGVLEGEGIEDAEAPRGAH